MDISEACQLGEAKIIESWHRNARPWTVAVREGLIESRNKVTNQAIVDAISNRSPGSVLDIGCGEGWLVRELATRNIPAIGVDVVPALIEVAQSAGGDFRVMSYEEIAAGKLTIPVDMIVCNFSLLGRESVDDLVRVAPSMLNSQGALIVQTLHPHMACGDLPYQDGWREGSWSGFGDSFTDPAPWYFRTLETWKNLFVDNGFKLSEIREPWHPEIRQPASVIFIAEK